MNIVQHEVLRRPEGEARREVELAGPELAAPVHQDGLRPIFCRTPRLNGFFANVLLFF